MSTHFSLSQQCLSVFPRNKSANHLWHPLERPNRISQAFLVQLFHRQLNNPEVFVIELLSLARDYLVIQFRVDRKINERFNPVSVSFGAQGIVLTLSIMHWAGQSKATTLTEIHTLLIALVVGRILWQHDRLPRYGNGWHQGSDCLHRHPVQRFEHEQGPSAYMSSDPSYGWWFFNAKHEFTGTWYEPYKGFAPVVLLDDP